MYTVYNKILKLKLLLYEIYVYIIYKNMYM